MVDIEDGGAVEEFSVFDVQASDHRDVAGVANDDEVVFFIGNRRFYAVAGAEKIIERTYRTRIHGVDFFPPGASVGLECEQTSERVPVEIIRRGQQNGARFVEELGDGKEYGLIFHENPLRSVGYEGWILMERLPMSTKKKKTHNYVVQDKYFQDRKSVV